MFDPTRPVMTPTQLANTIGERLVNTDHPLATCLVLAADGSDVRCNVADFDPAVFTLSPNTEVIPPNAPADFKRADKPAAPPVAPKAPAAPPVAPAATTPATAPQYEGAPQVFTMPGAGGVGFFRSDMMGRRLNPSDFATKEEAAASPVTLNGYTGDPL